MPASMTMPRRTQAERRDEAEQALLDAAERLFARKGIGGTSLAEIGEEAGYSRGLVHHHFGSKAALVERLAERTQQGFGERLDGLGPGREVDTLVAIGDAYVAFARMAGDQARAFFVTWGAALPRDAALRPAFATYDARSRAGIEACVRAGQQHGTIDPGIDPAGVALAFVGLLRGVAAQFLVDPGGVDLDAARGVAERFLRTALVPGGPG